MRILTAGFLCFAAVVITWKDGLVLGRLALALDQPRMAMRFLDDPYWSGVALYRMGHFEEAAQRFQAAGKAGFFNRGNALARTGRYSDAVAYYDAVLFYAPDDKEARANRAIVSALIEKETIQGTARGSIMPQGAGVTAQTQQQDRGGGDRTPAQIEQDKVMRVWSGQAVAASRQWLTTLADDPGRYLKLRIAAEHERRHELGISAPAGGDSW